MSTSIRSRLRSSSYSSSNFPDQALNHDSTSSTNELFKDRLNECDLCGQQEDNDGRRWLVTCSVCAIQYHTKCLDLRSEVFQDCNSRAFRNWVCKTCRRCLFCGNKRIKSSKNHLMSSLRSHPERELNSLEMINCKKCDSSIHTYCFFKLQKDVNLSPLSIRELRKRRKNFICKQCNGKLDRIEEHNEKNKDGSSSSTETSGSDIENSENNDNKKQLLRTQLRKLKQHMINMSNDFQNTIRTTRSRKSFQSNKVNNVQQNQKLDNFFLKNSLDKSPLKVTINNESQQNSIADDKKKRKRSKTDSIIIDIDQNNNKSPKKLKFSTTKMTSVIPTSHLSINGNNNNQYENTEQDSNIEKLCSVAGCDSRGHLSGAFDTHSIIETCPLFHNQTLDQCIERYQKRIERKDSKLSPRKLPPRVINLIQKNPKWNSIMNHRNAEIRSLHLEQIINITSSREPKLTGFTPKFDLDLFLEAQSRTAQMIHENSALELNLQIKDGLEDKVQSTRLHDVKSIIFGRHEISVWYNSPYSEEFQNCLKLFICEFCLKCMNSLIILQRHLNKCSLKHPPGNEIYRKMKISFFEVDGNKQKEYCQNLCLLAKLFLDHKTLFFDVEPFLFYVMTENDSTGMHLVGYFSKEKHSPNSYNVSCILTLPQYQRNGYGRMLIDFSYLLTRMENKVGSPEKPLSDLGIISYRSYWKYIIMEYLSTYEGRDILLKDISQQTGINSTDIVSTLQLMGILKYWKGKHLILVTDDRRKQFSSEVKRKRKIFNDKIIDPKFLHWIPTIYSQKSNK